jgi:hypothetical protein
MGPNYENFKNNAWKGYIESLHRDHQFPSDVTRNANGIIQVLIGVWGKQTPSLATTEADSICMTWIFNGCAVTIIVYTKNVIFWKCSSLRDDKSVEEFCDIETFPSEKFTKWMEKNSGLFN